MARSVSNKKMKTDRERIYQLVHALSEARDHLDYCGYGDKWERECAKESGLQELIEDTLEEEMEIVDSIS